MKKLGNSLGKKRIGKRQKTPMKLYTNIPNDFNYVKCELTDTIGMVGATDGFTFQNSGLAYIPLQVVIGTSASFSQYQFEYTRYKVTGVSVTAAQCSSPEHLRLIFGQGGPGCAVAFYPQNTTQAMGNSPRNKDTAMIIYPNVGSLQKKYWHIPDGYMDTGSNGLGTWNSTNSFAQQTGQLSICNLEANSASGAINVYLLRIIVYVVFSGKND